MNMLKAACDTLSLAREAGMDNTTSDNSELDYPHLVEMLTKMEAGGMSEGKMGRWLGWMQAAVVAGTFGAVCLEDCKRINMKWAD